MRSVLRKTFKGCFNWSGLWSKVNSMLFFNKLDIRAQMYRMTVIFCCLHSVAFASYKPPTKMHADTAINFQLTLQNSTNVSTFEQQKTFFVISIDFFLVPPSILWKVISKLINKLTFQIKTSEIVFIFLPAFYLIIWLILSSKIFLKIGFLQVWPLVFFWLVKSHFGEK